MEWDLNTSNRYNSLQFCHRAKLLQDFYGQGYLIVKYKGSELNCSYSGEKKLEWTF